MDIGLVYNEKKIEKIILSFEPKQGKYIKSLPLHKSQKILIENEDELRIEIKVFPNFELIQRILMQGNRVKVIEPKSLAEKIKNELKEALDNYKK
jgi:predicted DNA-binding transcriptional regulator YafY